MPDEEGLRVSRRLVIPLAELEWRFTPSGGPGGQHANTANTRAELVFDIESSPTLLPYQRQRLLARLGPRARVVASDERSQARNRDLALERMAGRLSEALKVDPVRLPTRPTLGSKQRRLDKKRAQSERKQERRPSGTDID